MRGRGVVVVGAFGVLIGGLWFLQGIGVVGGSFMSGDRLWLFIGLVVLLGGLTMIGTGVRSRGPDARLGLR